MHLYYQCEDTMDLYYQCEKGSLALMLSNQIIGPPFAVLYVPSCKNQRCNICRCIVGFRKEYSN